MSREGNRRVDISEIEEAAGDWLARRDSGRWTQADQESFDQWLKASTLHRVTYLRFEHAWEKALRLKALGAGVRADEIPPPGQWVLSPFFDHSLDERQAALASASDSDGPGSPGVPAATRKVRYALWGAAASVLLALGVYALTSTLERNQYSTPVGGIALVPMPDGSKVTLNTNTELRVAVSNEERRIDLKHGEAFFDVAKDPSRPFVVNAGNKRVVAVGTKFSVRREAQEILVVVTEGAVRIENEGKSAEAAAPIIAGTVARTNEAGVLLQSKPIPEAEEYLSWRSGVLVFRDSTLADAIAEFNRYNTRKIAIDDAAVAEMRIAGNFRSTNIEAFVRLLEQGYPLRVEQHEDRIVLKRN